MNWIKYKYLTWISRSPETHNTHTICGNKNHPNGAGHPATPLSLRFWETFKQERRKKLWGCSCAFYLPLGE